MPIGQRHAKHGARQHLRDVSGQFYWLFFRHKIIEPVNVAGPGWKINFFCGKKRVDNLLVFDTFRPTMKFETLNGILTFVLGVLVVAGVVLALNVAFVTHDTRNLEQTASIAKIKLAQAQGVLAATVAYNQKYPSTELTHILQSVQTKSANR